MRRFDAAIAADLLCHGAVDPPLALAELRRVLRPGGRLVVNMPAYTWLLSAHDRLVHNVRRCTARQLAAMLRDAGFIRVRPGYWNGLLLPLMVAQRKLVARACGSLGRCPVSAMARCHAPCHDGNRTSPALPPASGRFGAGDRGATMNDATDLREHVLDCRRRGPPASGCRSSSRSIAAPPRSGAWSRHCPRCAPPAGWRSCWSTTAAPTIPATCAKMLLQSATVPLTYIEHARNFGEHNAVMTGLATSTRRLRDHHGRRSAESARGGDPPLRPRAARQLGRGLHALRRQAACRLAQPRQPLRQCGRGSSARQAEGAVPVVLPLHVGVRGAGGDALPGSVSLRRRADHAGDAADRQHRGAAICRASRAGPTTILPAWCGYG